MFLSMLKYNGQYKRTDMFLHRQPFIHEHHSRATVHLDNVMIINYKLLRLFARADGNRLIGVNLIK